LKFGSEVHSSSGLRHIRFPSLSVAGDVAELQSGNCLLYTMLITQPEPTPAEDTDEHEGNTISIVPSLSIYLLVQFGGMKGRGQTDVSESYPLRPRRQIGSPIQ
jgi:hypothetical protein